MLPAFDFYSRPEYLADITTRIDKLKKGSRVELMTMAFDPRVPSIARLMDALYAAAGRGVIVRLSVDAMTFMKMPGLPAGPMVYGRPLSNDLPHPYGKIYGSLEQLRKKGGEYFIINQPTRAFTNPYAGRSHIKLCLIDGRVYIPSCNLDSDDHIDIIVGWDDAKTADYLRGIFEKITTAGNARQGLDNTDLTHTMGTSSTLFVDSGVKRQSLILGQAIDFIGQAKQEVTITCQYFPGSSTGQALESAYRRGAKVSIYFSGPDAHGSQSPLHELYNWRERNRLPASFFQHQMPSGSHKLHAKLLATEHGAITGSHNYVGIGVNFGTAEIALKVDDPVFAKAAKEKILGQLPV